MQRCGKCGKFCLDIGLVAVDRADIAIRAASNLANRHRSLASHQLEERPSFGRQRFPKKIFRREIRAHCFLPRNAADARRRMSLIEATPMVTVFIFVFSACSLLPKKRFDIAEDIRCLYFIQMSVVAFTASLSQTNMLIQKTLH